MNTSGLFIVGFPGGIARNTHVQIFQIDIVVADINNFRILDGIHIGSARSVGATETVNTRQRGVKFGVFVDDVVESLFILF